MKVLTVAGTRPELIRLSRLIPLLDEQADHVFVHTGQNVGTDLRDQFFDELTIRAPDRQLSLPDASSGHRVAAVLAATDDILADEQPDRLVILGDTDSGLAAYVAARRGIPVFHLEAGNRAYDPRVPEEINRRVIDHVSTVLMPYTRSSAANLAAEGFAAHRVVVIGNPIGEVLRGARVHREHDGRVELGIPTVLVRDVTERPELLVCGAVLLGGRTEDTIVDAARRMLHDGPSGDVPDEYRIPDVAARAAAVVLGPIPEGP